MPKISRIPRPYSENQKQAAACSSKRRQHTDEIRTIPLRGSVTTGKKNNLASVLNNYLVAYDARLIEIDYKYPLGNIERPEWIQVHRRTGVNRLIEILAANNEPHRS